MKKIGIVMPVYNVEQYLEKAISSVIDQTYQDWQLYIVIDGSLDNSVFIANKYAKDDQRIKVINKPNGGLSDARNTAIDICQEEYITFIDSDDFIASDYLEILYNNITKNNCDISTVKFQAFYTDCDITNEIESETLKILNSEQALEEMLYQKGTTNCAWGKLYKTILFKNIRYPKGKNFEDVATTYKLFAKSKKIAISNLKKYYYRKRTESIANSKFNSKRLVSLEFISNQTNFIKSNYPNITNATINREFAENLYILQMLPPNEKEYINQIYSNLKKYRKNILLDKKSRKYYRLIALLMYLGKNAVYKIVKKHKKNKRINDYLTIHQKNKIIYIISKNNLIPKSLKKRVYIFLASNYGNIGDCAMAISQKKFAEDLYPEYEIIEILFTDTYKYLKSVSKVINKDDIIMLSGGGHFGNLYETAEEKRRFIINKFRKNKIISLPQTIDFSNDGKGQKSFDKTKRIYNNHPNLTLIARETQSYKIMLENFPKTKIILSPDIAFYTGVNDQKLHRNKITFCLRDDDEILIDTSNRGNLIYHLREKYGHENIFITNTFFPNCNFTVEQREQVVSNKLREFSESKVVIADRLHAMIFCALTNTPCIIFPNKNGKTINTYNNWLKKVPNIKIINEFDEDKIIELIEQLEKYKENSPLNLSRNFTELKEKLRKE